jgi:DNA-binding MarR family transcriptional regulator
VSAASRARDDAVLAELRLIGGRGALPMEIAPRLGETIGRVSDSLQRLRKANLVRLDAPYWTAIEEPRP